MNASGLKILAAVNDVANLDAWNRVISEAKNQWPIFKEQIVEEKVEAISPIEIPEEEIIEKVSPRELSAKISLEKDLQAYLMGSLETLEAGLKFHSAEVITEVGRIDILASDKNSDFVIIELKAEKVNSKVLSQILPYMGWIKVNEELNPKGTNVYGIIVAYDFDEKLIVASEASPFIKLRRYRLNFTFEQIK